MTTLSNILLLLILCAVVVAALPWSRQDMRNGLLVAFVIIGCIIVFYGWR